MPIDDMPDLLLVDEVADFLRVNRMTIHRMINAGQFPGAFQLGDAKSGWRIPKEAVAAYLARKQGSDE